MAPIPRDQSARCRRAPVVRGARRLSRSGPGGADGSPSSPRRRASPRRGPGTGAVAVSPRDLDQPGITPSGGTAGRAPPARGQRPGTWPCSSAMLPSGCSEWCLRRPRLIQSLMSRMAGRCSDGEAPASDLGRRVGQRSEPAVDSGNGSGKVVYRSSVSFGRPDGAPPWRPTSGGGRYTNLHRSWRSLGRAEI